VLSTVPFTIVNNTLINASGGLAYPDDQVWIALYGQDTNADFYYFDQHGNPTAAAGQSSVTPFKLTDLTPAGGHSYVMQIPDVLTGGFGISAARMYFAMGGEPEISIIGGKVVAPIANNTFFDFIEFTYNSANEPGNLNIDTTNVDQFSIPIQLTVTPQVSGQPAEVGTATLRDTVIEQWKSFTSGPNDPYAIALWPVSNADFGPYRILNPSGVFQNPNNFYGLQPVVSLVQVFTNPITTVNASQTTIQVNGDGPFPNPADGAFKVQIDAEVMLVTASTPGTNGTAYWTVTRGVDGTTAASHAPSSMFTKLGPAISATQNTLSFVGTNNYPQTYPFNVLVDNEIMKVTGLKSFQDGITTWFVDRAQSGTVAAAHNANASVYYNGVVDLPLNSIFNEAIDALFSKYYNTSEQLEILSGADGNLYSGTVQVSGGLTYFEFTGTGGTFEIYYPFFEENRYLWAGYNPTLTVGSIPSSAQQADAAFQSPSQMVFGNSGVFADSAYRGLPANEAKIVGDLENQIVAALNRGVSQLPGHTADGTGSWKDASLFYANNPHHDVYNRYAAFLHQSSISIGGLNYGFAYDDQAGQASDISVDNPTGVRITLGPWSTHETPTPDPGPDPGPGPGPGPAPTPDPTRQITKRKFFSSTAATELPQGSPAPHSQVQLTPPATPAPSLSIEPPATPPSPVVQSPVVSDPTPSVAIDPSEPQSQPTVADPPKPATAFTGSLFSLKLFTSKLLR
jgi:hypothetical protein